MRGLFITSLECLGIAENLGRGDKIGHETFLTNDRDIIAKLIHVEAVQWMGLLEAHAIVSRPVVYSHCEIPESEHEKDAFLFRRMRQVAGFLNCLWMLKDNSINQDHAFLIYKITGKYAVDSNVLALKYSDARGKRDVVTFSRDELRKSRQIFAAAGTADALEKSVSGLTKRANRLDRAFYLLQRARCDSDLGLKVASYCTALESLLASSQAELAHQLAERVACLLCADAEERQRVYRTVKRCYAVRSAVLHGDYVRNSHLSDLQVSAEECDGILRAALLRVLTHEPTRTAVLGNKRQA